MSQRIVARVRVSMDIDVEDVWNDDTTVAQVRKQAAETAEQYVNALYEAVEKGHEPKIHERAVRLFRRIVGLRVLRVVVTDEPEKEVS